MAEKSVLTLLSVKRTLINERGDIVGKPMKSKGTPDPTPVLEKLYENKLLRSKVDDALDSGKPYELIIELCKQYGLELSLSGISRYKQKRQQSQEEGKPLAEYMDLRKKSVNDLDKSIAGKEEKPFADVSTIGGIDSDLTYLDKIINLGYSGLVASGATPSPKDVLKAIEVKAKITGNAYRGLTIEGYKKLKVENEAKANAMASVIAKYVPQDKQEEVQTSLQEAEKQFYKTLDLSDSERQLNREMHENGLDQ